MLLNAAGQKEKRPPIMLVALPFVRIHLLSRNRRRLNFSPGMRFGKIDQGIHAFEKYHILKEEAIQTNNQTNLSRLNAIVDFIDAESLEAEAYHMINEA